MGVIFILICHIQTKKYTLLFFPPLRSLVTRLSRGTVETM